MTATLRVFALDAQMDLITYARLSFITSATATPEKKAARYSIEIQEWAILLFCFRFLFSYNITFRKKKKETKGFILLYAIRMIFKEH